MLTISNTTKYDLRFESHFEKYFLFERYAYLFEMIYDKDDTHFDMIMTFISRGAGFYLSNKEDINATEGVPEGAAPRHSTQS